MLEFIDPFEIKNVVNWNLQSYTIITYYLLLTYLALRNIDFFFLKTFLKLLEVSHENNQILIIFLMMTIFLVRSSYFLFLVALFINVIVTAYALEVPCLTSSLIEHKPFEYRCYENRCGFMPRVECAGEILFRTSVTLIPYQLLLLAMDINPNPCPTFCFNKDFSSLAPTIKQRFNQYKCTAKKVTRHEFHLKTYQFY